MTAPLPERRAVPRQMTWDSESVFASPDAFDAALEVLRTLAPDLAEFQGHLADSPESLADWFDLLERAMRQAARLQLYAQMAYSVDAHDEAAGDRLERTRIVITALGAATAFGEPELIAAGLDRLRAWVASTPRLGHLGHYLDRLQTRAAHLRSPEVEEVLTQASGPIATAVTIHGVLANSELRFRPAAGDGQEHEVAQSTISALLTNPNREVRRTAWESYADAHLDMQNTLATALSAGVKRDVFNMRARRYESSLHAALEPAFIPLRVFHNTIDVFRANASTWHRYWRLRQRTMKLDRLAPYDLRAPLTTEPLALSYRQTVDWICAGLEPLGDAYVDRVRRGCVEDRWVDILPNLGKRMGAYSSGTMDTHPFIFMSFTDDIYSLSTLAHELGHSMHSLNTRTTQPWIYTGYGTFLAEVASNLNQALVRGHLLANAEQLARETGTSQKGFEIAVLEEAMANFYRYFFIMPALARLELAMHERVEGGQALTASWLNENMAEIITEVYGDEVAAQGRDRDRTGSTWAQFHTHLYSNFYVFQYATGIAAASRLAERISGGESTLAGEYHELFLKAGGSRYPMETLQLLGVDMSTREPVEAAFRLLASYVDRLEELTA